MATNIPDIRITDDNTKEAVDIYRRKRGLVSMTEAGRMLIHERLQAIGLTESDIDQSSGMAQTAEPVTT